MTEEQKRRRLTRAESKARTRARLLDAAAELLAHRGLAATSVEEIAERAGYSIGAIYSNFPSKEQLVLALLDEHLEAGARELVQRLDRAGEDPRARDAAAGRYFDQVAEEHQAWFLLSAELWLYAVRHPEIRPRLAAIQAICRDRIEALLAVRFAKHGLAPPLPAGHIARMVMALVDGLVQQRLLEPEAPTGDALRAALRWLLDGALAEADPNTAVHVAPEEE